ncbi:MAG TPA: hypothetical protein VGP33_02000 [Chloroflexota bacterium]|jgi:hypothetical protein|nr:hypothetical protein [Chloroflexota bacterium]
MYDVITQPVSPASRRKTGHAAIQAGDDSQPGGFVRGAWVEVASGPAQGARGRIVERAGNNITIQALLLGQRPLLLTVASAVCAPLETPAEGR